MAATTDSSEAVLITVGELERDALREFDDEFSKRERKIHRFPDSLRGLGDQYIAPMMVAIGPYHHGVDNLKTMEKVKHVAACNLGKYLGNSVEEMYAAVHGVAGDALGHYYADRLPTGIDDEKFATMMFHDACFLLLYMVIRAEPAGREGLSPSLLSCLYFNRAVINHDIMLLENQLPWLVMEALFTKWSKLKSVAARYIVLTAGTFHTRFDLPCKPLDMDVGRYRPPHLLGLLWFYKTESRPLRKSHEGGPISISAIELAEVGIKLRARRTADFTDMGLKKGALFGKLFVTPLSLDDQKACWLVNMAAFEVCTATSIWEDARSTAICSYLALLAMLVDRREDVHELRRKRLVHGELTNKEMLHFFKTLTKYLYGGRPFFNIMKEIDDYKRKRRIVIRVHEFIYKNLKAIVTVLSLIGVLVGMFKAILSVKQHRQ